MTFTFCGYAFRPRMAFDKNRKQVYTGFLPAVAPEKLTRTSAPLLGPRVPGLDLAATWGFTSVRSPFQGAISVADLAWMKSLPVSGLAGLSEMTGSNQPRR